MGCPQDKDISQMLIHQCGFLQLDQPPHGGDHCYTAILSSEPMGDSEYLAPVRDGYHSIIARSLQHNIFPGYFHGKCAPLGTAVPGCPNPDCPVVCGTPGSMVHFYSKLVSIAFETVRADLWVHSKPGSGARKAVERRVLARASGTRNGRSCRSKDGVRRELRSILTGLAGRLAEQCGGPPLSKCNWAQSMKQYILTFP